MMSERSYEMKFEDTIRVVYPHGMDNVGIADAVEQYRRDGYKGIHRSGAFFRTPVLNATENKALIDMESIVSAKVLDYLTARDTGFTEVENLKYWGHIYDKHSSMGRHIHPIAFVSAVYYARVDERGSGNICFDRHSADVLAYAFDKFRPQSSLMTRQSYEVTPETGMLLIFPSWMSHHVAQYMPSADDAKCVSVIFNYAARGANQSARWDKHVQARTVSHE